ncbi:MAG: hypothetical protein ACM3X7_13820 [Solirubrobacterales bacterium]
MLYWCDNWTFLKYNNNLYVLNTPIPVEESEVCNLIKVGKVEKEIPRIFNPEYNNVSNGLPEGTDIYINNRTFYSTLNVVIKYKDKFYEL